MINKQINNKKAHETESSLVGKNFDLWVILDQTGDVISKTREMELNQFQLTKAQASILHRLITENQDFTIPEIAKQSAKEVSSVLNLVNRMRKNGLVEKSQKDSEKILISVTDKGRELYSNSTQNSIEMIFSILSNEEKQQLNTSLTKLRDKARELLGIDFKPPFLKK